LQNWLQRSISENKPFSCPQCRQKIDTQQIKTANDLQTARIIVNLLDKGLNNYHSLVAACSKCQQIKTLEACFECSQPLCNDCVKDHFNEWKKQTNDNISRAENFVSSLINNLGT
jgi:hypothetical protein